jgi:hypothetical protein
LFFITSGGATEVLDMPRGACYEKASVRLLQLGFFVKEWSMRFFCFHLMPWAHLPEDFAQRYDSAWVTCPNSLYDPELGHPLYNRYLD